MLEPQSRTLLLDALQPPPGYRFDRAIATTFTLDLLALLSAPLAFSLIDIAGDPDDEAASPLALLDAARRHADRITVFTDAGHIAVPAAGQPLFALLEDAVVPVRAPRAGGLFHPKIWLVRFTCEGRPPNIRLLCASRNLTFDRSWDTLLVLDGVVGDEAVDASAPVARFAETLSTLALRPVSAERAAANAALVDELRRTRFAPPPGVAKVVFHPMGVPGGSQNPFAGRIDRLLVMSPYVTAATLTDLTGRRRDCALISRAEELERLEPAVLQGLSRILVLDDHALPEPDDAASDGGSAAPFAARPALHAKCYVADAGWNARVWTGSANATDNAFRANVEFMVELRGRKRVLGIDALLSTGTPGVPGLLTLMQDYAMHEEALADDPATESGRRAIEDSRAMITAAPLSVHIEADEHGQYALRVAGVEEIERLPASVVATCHPVTLGGAHEVRFGDGRHEPCTFHGLTVTQVSSFIAVTLRAAAAGMTERFTLCLPLHGAPDDRAAAVLASVLSSPRDVMRFVLLLLASDDATQSAHLDALRRGLGPGDAANGDGEGLPLLEPLLRSLAADPSGLDRVAKVVDDLRRTDEGRQLLPEEFDATWTAIWSARTRLGGR